MPERITFERFQLLTALHLVSKVRPWQRPLRAGERSTPALIKIVADRGVATITSANLDMTIRGDIPCDMLGSGTMYLPLHNLTAAVEKSPEGAQIMLEPNGADTVLRAGRLRVQMTGMSADMASMRPAVEGQSLSILAATMRAGLRAAAPAVLDDNKRPYLGGVYLTGDGAALSFVGMDDNRVHSAAAEDSATRVSAILPEALADLLAAVLPETGDVAIVLNPGRAIELAFNRIRISSGLIQGQFPNYAPLLGTAKSRTLTAKADELLRDLELVALVSDPKTRDIRLDLSFNGCSASAFRRLGNGVDAGKVDLIAKYSGSPFAIGFAMRLVSDALSMFGSDVVEWGMDGPSSPTVITSAARPGLEMMISPMSLVGDHLRAAA